MTKPARPPLATSGEASVRQKVLDEHGLIPRRDASIDDVSITDAERRVFGPCPDGVTGGLPLR